MTILDNPTIKSRLDGLTDQLTHGFPERRRLAVRAALSNLVLITARAAAHGAHAVEDRASAIDAYDTSANLVRMLSTEGCEGLTGEEAAEHMQDLAVAVIVTMRDSAGRAA